MKNELLEWFNGTLTMVSSTLSFSNHPIQLHGYLE